MNALASTLHFAPLVWALAGAAALRLTPLARRRPWLVGLALLVLLLPLGGEGSAAAWLAGRLGEPSLTLAQCALLLLAGRPLPTLPGRRGALLLLLLAAIFYTLALGATAVDPYAWGYQPRPLLGGLALLALLLARRGEAGWLWLLALDLAGWSLGLGDSDNLWDALFDPILIAALVVAPFVTHRRQRHD